MRLLEALSLLATGYGRLLDLSTIQMAACMLELEGTNDEDPLAVVYEILANEAKPPSVARILEYFHGVRVTVRTPMRDVYGSIPLNNGVPARYSTHEAVIPAATGLRGIVDEDVLLSRVAQVEARRKQVAGKLDAWATKLLAPKQT